MNNRNCPLWEKLAPGQYRGSNYENGATFFVSGTNGAWRIARTYDLSNPIHAGLPFYGMEPKIVKSLEEARRFVTLGV